MRKFNINFSSNTSYKNHAIYLEKMAKKGFLLKKWGMYFSKYELIDPSDYDFEVVPFNEKSVIESLDISGEAEFIDLAEKQGWTYCCKKNPHLIFYKHKSLNIGPIHSDKEIEYKIVKNILIKNDIFISLMFLLILFIINPLSIANDYRSYINNYGYFMMINAVTYILIILSSGVRGICWIISNKLKLNNKNLIKSLPYKIDRIFDTLMFLLLDLILISLISYNLNTTGITIFFSVLVMMILGIFYDKYFRTKLRSKWENLLVLIVLSFISISITTSIIIKNATIDDLWEENESNFILDISIEVEDYIDDLKNKKVEEYTTNSIFVPSGIEYFIRYSSSDNHGTIAIKSYEAINSFIAKQMYKAMFNEQIKNSSENKDIVTQETIVDGAFYFKNVKERREGLIFWKNNVVVVFSYYSVNDKFINLNKQDLVKKVEDDIKYFFK